MEVKSFTAKDLFHWLTSGEEFLLLDVRNDEEFARFKIEGPYPFEMINVPYMEFVEHEDESVAKVPEGKKLRIVCAKEGSSKFVGEILVNHGYKDVSHMLVGINAWGNLLAPVRVNPENGYALILPAAGKSQSPQNRKGQPDKPNRPPPFSKTGAWDENRTRTKLNFEGF